MTIWKYESLNKRPCQAQPKLVGINSNEPFYYSFTVDVNNCVGSCSIIDDPYARMCVPNKVKNMNVKVFNLMSGVNETIFLVQRESCKCRLNENVYNSKWNHNKCRYECKEINGWSSCKKKVACGILVHMIVTVIKHVKLVRI